MSGGLLGGGKIKAVACSCEMRLDVFVSRVSLRMCTARKTVKHAAQVVDEAGAAPSLGKQT